MKDNKKEKGYVKINIKDEISKSAIIQINYEFEKGTLKRMLKSLDKIIFEMARRIKSQINFSEKKECADNSPDN